MHLLNTSEHHSFESEINDEASVDETLFELDSIEQIPSTQESILSSEEEHTPKLFSEETSEDENKTPSTEMEQKLFDQENNQEEDFEIPAFLRRQKF